MKMSTAMLTIRTDDRLKKAVGATLKRLGLNYSSAINIYFHAIQETHGIPFPVKLTNQDTIDAINELDSGKGESFDKVDDMLRKLDAE
jgi:DNA-damage-inducible protein J